MKKVTIEQLQEAADALGIGSIDHVTAIDIRPGAVEVTKFILDSAGYRVFFDEYGSEGTYTEVYKIDREEV